MAKILPCIRATFGKVTPNDMTSITHREANHTYIVLSNCYDMLVCNRYVVMQFSPFMLLCIITVARPYQMRSCRENSTAIVALEREVFIKHNSSAYVY